MNASTSKEPIRILLIEDEEIDRMALDRALKRSGVHALMSYALDGAEGMAMLRGEHGQDPLVRPHLVLLDLNMPRMGGIEFLDRLRADETLRRTVVFVLTTSAHEVDRAKCYDRGVAGFIVKQNMSTQSNMLLEMIERYWAVVDLPLE